MSSRSKFGFRGTNRSSAIAVVACTLGVLVSPLGMTAAPAAATSHYASLTIQAASQNANHPAGSPASVLVDYQLAPGPSTPTDIYYTVLNAANPDYANAPSPTGVLCGPTTTSPVTCSIANTNAGVDQIQVFADDAGSSRTDPGNVFALPTTVVFSGPPTGVTLSPASSSAAVGTCVPYTLTSTDSGGRRVYMKSFTLSAPAVVSYFDSTCEAPLGGSVVTTDKNGTVTFGVASSNQGVIAVTATSNDNPTNGSGSVTWTQPTSYVLTSTPTSITNYVGAPATFTIQVTDPSGRPAEGLTVRSQSSVSAHDAVSCAATPGHTPVTTTDHNGKILCTVTNMLGPVSSDVLTMWIGGPTFQEGVDPATRPTVTFQALPNTDNAHFSLTCPDQSNGGTASTTSCDVPTDQHSVAYTATVLDVSTNAPIPGVRVDFTGVSGPPSALITPATGQSVTGSDGTATFIVTDASPANLDVDSVSAQIGTTDFANNAGPPTVTTWQTRAPIDITLTPLLQTVSKGSTVSVAGQVVDQFGTPFNIPGGSITFFSSNPPGTATVATTATGSAPFSYPSNSSSVDDSISAVDGPASSSQSAIVKFVTGPATASTVTVDTSGNGTSLLCPSAGAPVNTNLTLGVSVTQICAVAKNSANETLAGRPITFTVSTGKIDATSFTATSTTTYTTVTGPTGIASAFVKSTTSGVQTVTATVDGVSGTGTLTYAGPTLDKARNVAVSPASANLTAGNQQKFTWTVIDQFANPVNGATLIYTQAGAGLSGATSSGSIVTGADGTASVTITTTSTDNGVGSITATLQQPTPPTPLNQCTNLADNPVGTTAGNCTASATYTVINASAPATLALKAATGVTKGHSETITATATNANGTPAANQVIRFLVTGANGLIGSSVTNANGVATLVYPAKHAGTDAVSAYIDLNNDATQQGNEPGKHTKAIIAGATEHPTIRLTSKHGSVTVHVGTKPALARDKVTYYVKRYGAFHKIGTSKTGILGHASMKFFFPKGVVRHFKAKVAGQAGIKGAKTHAKKITVR